MERLLLLLLPLTVALGRNGRTFYLIYTHDVSIRSNKEVARFTPTDTFYWSEKWAVSLLPGKKVSTRALIVELDQF